MSSNGAPPAKKQKIDPVPTGLGDYPAVILRFRPEGKTTKPKQLEYFTLQALGECARMLLEVSETPYDSIMHFSSSAMKAYAPFGQLPLYKGDELGDMILSQSGSICRHIAKMVGADGSGPVQQAKVDALFELSKDLRGAKPAIQDPSNASAGQLAMFLKAAEQHAPAKGDGFFVGNGLTLADVAIFEVLYLFMEMKSDSLDAYPKLKAFYTAFKKTPAIAAYLASDRHIPLTKKEKCLEAAGYNFVTPLRPSVVAEIYEP